MLAGRYEVGELIGRGGMAEVHGGYDARLGRDVAVKILRSELARDSTFLLRFRREAKAAASLNHPSIVAVFDSGEDVMHEAGGAEMPVPFIVMEYVRGRTLREILHEDGPVEPMRATRIMAQVLQALNYSHQHGIIHRDIKPANVMLDSADRAKVMDFGIARAIADTAATMTNTSIVVGTAQYLSPEQAQGRDIDARSDLYSAGCLLYELVTGRPPFVGDSPVAIAYQHVGEPPQPPSVHNSEVPANLDVVILHALNKDPDRRYQSGDEFAADLESVLRREPTIAAAAAVDAGELAPAPLPEKVSAPVAPATTSITTRRADHDKSQRNRALPWVVGVLAALAVTLGLWLGRDHLGGDPAPVAVPYVIGQPEANANQQITDAGLMPVSQPVANAAAPGTVVEQDPREGERPPNSTIQLRVSTGPGQVVVPNLRNFQQDTAIQKLSDLGLEVQGIDQVDSYEVAQGSVVATEPKAEENVAAGSAVTLKISNGQTVVPEVVGMSEAKAQEALSKVGLRYRREDVTSTRSVGSVIAQSYQAKTRVPVGTEVVLDVVRSRPQTQTVTRTETVTPTAPAPPATPTDPDSPSPTPTSTDDPPADGGGQQ
nr:Stk1 family PASTA domain-containing Ser/Thr kinase [Kineosphaera limosa]